MAAFENRNEKYHGDEIVAQLSEPMDRWGRMGFVRGFAGVRTEALPKGRMTLPSAAFNELAEKSLNAGDPSDEEIALRQSFIRDVDQKLREMQGDAISRHFKYAAFGQAADLGAALFILAIIGGLLLRVGPFQPLVLVLIFLLGIKILFVRHSARRLLKITEAAFKSKTDDIRLPWM